ncbi:hypothetical protein ABB02_01783 [Clostridiaceae bacterium JG1575]|nr:hypothetical protein ABB02_01783 [Clostridiaceae bacterium JG1575]
MNVQVAYFSKTGHSKTVALAIAKGLNCPVQSVENWTKAPCDLLFLVGGIYAGKSNEKMMRFVRSLTPESLGSVCLVTTCGDGKTPQKYVRQALEAQGIPCEREEFICKGSFFIFSRRHPSEEELSNAIAFAQKKVNESQSTRFC